MMRGEKREQGSDGEKTSVNKEGQSRRMRAQEGRHNEQKLVSSVEYSGLATWLRTIWPDLDLASWSHIYGFLYLPSAHCSTFLHRMSSIRSSIPSSFNAQHHFEHSSVPFQ